MIATKSRRRSDGSDIGDQTIRVASANVVYQRTTGDSDHGTVTSNVGNVRSNGPRHRHANSNRRSVGRPRNFHHFHGSQTRFIVFRQTKRFYTVRLRPARTRSERCHGHWRSSPRPTGPLRRLTVGRSNVERQVRPRRHDNPNNNRTEREFGGHVNGHRIQTFQRSGERHASTARRNPGRRRCRGPLAKFRFTLLFTIQPPRRETGNRNSGGNLNGDTTHSVPMSRYCRPESGRNP